jgi:hypothetical protein
MSKEYEKYLKEIKPIEMKNWRSQKESAVFGIMEEFLESEMQMAEVDLEILPEPRQKKGSDTKSTRQDTFASSFYVWKKKITTKDKLKQLGIDILLIRRDNKIALKKKVNGASKP